ncbi:MAG TPA: hypothetical protein VF469_30940, partial [Kofleriaceae bacterium]
LPAAPGSMAASFASASPGSARPEPAALPRSGSPLATARPIAAAGLPPTARVRRRLYLWVGGIVIASLIGVVVGGSVHRAGSPAASNAEPRPIAAELPADAGAMELATGDARIALATPLDATAPSPPADAALAPPPPHDPPVAQHPVHAAAPAHPSAADEYLRAAEDAFQGGNVLRQFTQAEFALRASPRSVRARYLVGDALLKSGDLDRGCNYLAPIQHVPAARERARAAGCPGN